MPTDSLLVPIKTMETVPRSVMSLYSELKLMTLVIDFTWLQHSWMIQSSSQSSSLRLTAVSLTLSSVIHPWVSVSPFVPAGFHWAVCTALIIIPRNTSPQHLFIYIMLLGNLCSSITMALTRYWQVIYVSLTHCLPQLKPKRSYSPAHSTARPLPSILSRQNICSK